MNDKDIKTLIEVLKHKKREDLAVLLENCSSEVEQSGQYGSVWNSIISSFLIYAPVEKYYKLKDLTEEDKKTILESVLDIYPVTYGEPEITSIEFRISKDENYEKEELPTYIGRTVRVFLSYSTATQEDKEFAGKLKQQLEEFGLEVFLAHEDINPSSDWQEKILENLKSTDIFMPIITENFRKSFWTDQESGIAFGNEKFIMPIAIDKNMPYGFLGKIQAYRQNSKLAIDACEIIEAIVQSNPKFSSPLLDSLVKAFANSSNYDDAGAKSNLLLKFNTVNNEQANEIFRSILQNNQIYHSRSAHKNINSLFTKYKHLLDKKLIERLQDKNGLIDVENHVLEIKKEKVLLDIPF